MFKFKSQEEIEIEQLKQIVENLESENSKLKHSFNLINQLNPIIEKATVTDTFYQVLTQYVTEATKLLSEGQGINANIIKEYLEALFPGCTIEVFIGLEIYNRLYQNFHRQGTVDLNPDISDIDFNIEELYDIKTNSEMDLEKILNSVSNKSGLTMLSDVKIKPLQLSEFSAVGIYTLEPLLGLNPGFVLFLDRNKTTFSPTEKEMINIFMNLLQPVINSKIMTEQLIKEATSAIKTAYTDPLTGISNRGKFNKDYLYNTENVTDIIAYLDLNRLKFINDNYGHDVADRVLIKLGEMINNFANELRGTAYRFGGDEFIIRLPNTLDREELEYRFQLLSDNFSGIEFKTNQGKVFNSGISIGVVKEQRQYPNPESVVKYADKLMYKSKRETFKIEYSWRQ